MTDPYIYAIAALLPLTAAMLISQLNPYNALILRGILGAVSALLYAVLGAADVALTEALMGTLLAIALYAVAVRSSMVMRLGVLQELATETASHCTFDQIMADLRASLAKRYLRVELVLYGDLQALQQALVDRDIHTTISPKRLDHQADLDTTDLEPRHSYQTVTRIRRLYEILQAELPSGMSLMYVNSSDNAASPPEQHP